MRQIRANKLKRGDFVVGKLNEGVEHIFPDNDQYLVLAVHKVRRQNNTGPLEIRVQTHKDKRFLDLNRIMLIKDRMNQI